MKKLFDLIFKKRKKKKDDESQKKDSKPSDDEEKVKERLKSLGQLDENSI